MTNDKWITGKEWIDRRDRTDVGGCNHLLFIGTGPILRYNYPDGTVLFDQELYEDDRWHEPYMGYTPGEDDLPEKGAWPGEMYRA